jgi:TonB family protein
MLVNANAKINSTPANRGVREITAVCAKHHLAHVSPENLAEFMQALDDNKLLAMKFWSLVARMSEPIDADPTNPDWIREVIVEGVTGQTVAEVSAASPEHQQLLDRLSRMLAGEDLHGPAVDLPDEPVSDLRFVAPRNGRAGLTDADAAVPLSTHTLTAVSSSRKPLRPVHVVADSAWIPDGRPRLVLEPSAPSLPTSDFNLDEVEDDRRILIPLSGYAEADSQRIVSPRRLSAGLLLVMVVAYGWWIAQHRHDSEWGRLRDSIRAGFASAIATWNSNGAPGINSRVYAANPAANNANSNPVAPSAPTNQPSTTLSKPPAKPAPVSANPSIATAIQPQRDPSSPVRIRVPEGDASETSNVSESDGRVVVPEAVMQANLTSSRVPVYPEAAKANHIEGLVVLQAVVNKDGAVGHLRVVQGNPALRRAAMEAASTWRYRPYLLNGKPIDVSTTISVDFSETE